jgi:hypothetical protein
MRTMRAPRSWLRACVVALACLVAPSASLAQDATWVGTLGDPTPQDFNTGANWSTGTVPIGTGFFGTSPIVDLSTSADTTLLGISLNVDAPAYALTNNSSYRLEFTGTGIVVNGRSLLLINDGIVVFSGTSTAGRSTIENFGVVQFEDSSTAGSAAIYNGCCLLFSGKARQASRPSPMTATSRSRARARPVLPPSPTTR